MANELNERVVKAYDSMPRRRWDRFSAYCEANDMPTSLLSFVEYLLVCAERDEAIDAAAITPPTDEGRREP